MSSQTPVKATYRPYETGSALPVKNRWTHGNAKPRLDATAYHSRARSWSAGHGYRTSYKDMSKKKNCGTKYYAVPGYQGHIRGKEGQSELGQTYTNITRTCFINDNTRAEKGHNRYKSTINDNPVVSTESTMRSFYGGRTADKGCGSTVRQETFDQTRPSFTRFHGRETMLPVHPAWLEPKLTTTELSFVSPTSQPRPTATTKFATGSQLFDKAQFVSNRKSCDASGYYENA